MNATQGKKSSLFVVFAILAGLGLIYRIPFLLNPYHYNSDQAVIGLQALRFLDGDWQWYLWTVGYQTSFPSMLVAGVYKVFGEGPYQFMSVPIVGYLVALFLVFHMLTRRVGVLPAALLSSTLLFLSYSVNQYSVYPNRQWCFVCSALTLWLIDYEKDGEPQQWSLALGVFFAFFTLYMDFITIVFFPSALFFAWMVARQSSDPRKLFKALIVGFAIGAGFLIFSRLALAPPSNPPLAFSPKTFLTNVPVLFEECLPALFNIWPETWGDVFRGGMKSVYALLQLIGALLILFLIIGSAKTAFSDESVPQRVRRLGIYALSMFAVTILGFIGSSKAGSLETTRYLGPVYYVFPLMLAPLLVRWGPQRFSKFLIPYLVCAFIGGWVTSAPPSGSFLPRTTVAGGGEDIEKLRDYLSSNGVRHGRANYWISYTLSHIYSEDPLIVPRTRWQDRYPKYTSQVDAAQVIAEIYQQGEPGFNDLENFDEVGSYRVVLVRK